MKIRLFIVLFLFFTNFSFALEKELKNTTQIVNNETKNTTQAEQELIVQNKKFDEVIEGINKESYLKTFKNKKEINSEIYFLTNRININKKQKNTLAVKRDEIKVLILKEQLIYEKTIKNIIIGKQKYKEQKYFEDILGKAIKQIEENSVDIYTALYEKEKNANNSISNEFKENYTKLYNQKFDYLFILNNLAKNISKFRQTNFFIDEFNLNYFIKKINSIEGVSFISILTSRYLKFSIGEIVVVFFVFLFFMLFQKLIVSISSNLLSKIFIRNKQEDTQKIKTAIKTPFIFAIYTLAVNISLFILINDTTTLNKIIPWVNTTYMALLTWVIYLILDNSIDIYASSFLEKYPNVRKEMIVFILKIIRIILIILVVMFLFTQLGIDIKAIAASLGVGGIAIALASKDTLENFFGSITIMTDNSFSQGDWIKTSEVEGTVVDIRMRTTRIRTFDNSMITIPNSKLANTHIQNWSKRVIGRRIKMSIGITYESKMEDIKKLKDDIYEMLLNHPGIATEKNSVIKNPSNKKFEAIKREDLHGIKKTLLVYIDEYADSSINILVYCFSKSPVWENWLEVKEDLIMKIAQLTEKNNCEFAYPTKTLWLKK